tara:strand:+ start:636 stop:1727 length:1092 start_codon:yes stop_codon:yes gene_type:complete
MKIYNQSTFDKWPIPDKSVQAIITSPPYWGLRKYDIPDVIIGSKNGCEHEFNLKNITRETGQQGAYGRGSDKTKIFKESYSEGFCLKCHAWKGQYGLEPSYKEYIEHTRLWAKEAWRVLKDNGLLFLNIGDSFSGGGAGSHTKPHDKQTAICGKAINKTDLPSKCKILLPHRVAISLIDDGFICRNDIVWHKMNAMPESVTDRFSKKFEFIFMLSKKGKYYFDLDAVRGKHKRLWNENNGGSFSHPVTTKEHGITGYAHSGSYPLPNPLGKNPGDCWEINTQPSPFKHYAMWPEKLVKHMILCSTKAGDAVLDPFCGSGTTLRIAESLQRTGKGIDLGYQDIQEQRLKHIQKEIMPTEDIEVG